MVVIVCARIYLYYRYQFNHYYNEYYNLSYTKSLTFLTDLEIGGISALFNVMLGKGFEIAWSGCKTTTSTEPCWDHSIKKFRFPGKLSFHICKDTLEAPGRYIVLEIDLRFFVYLYREIEKRDQD